MQTTENHHHNGGRPSTWNNMLCFCRLPFSELQLICSCTHILSEPPINDNSIIFCSVEYATKVSISVALCLLGPEMFSMNIFFRHLVVVTIQLKLNVSSPCKLWRQILCSWVCASWINVNNRPTRCSAPEVVELPVPPIVVPGKEWESSPPILTQALGLTKGDRGNGST